MQTISLIVKFNAESPFYFPGKKTTTVIEAEPEPRLVNTCHAFVTITQTHTAENYVGCLQADTVLVATQWWRSVGITSAQKSTSYDSNPIYLFVIEQEEIKMPLISHQSAPSKRATTRSRAGADCEALLQLAPSPEDTKRSRFSCQLCWRLLSHSRQVTQGSFLLAGKI